MSYIGGGIGSIFYKGSGVYKGTRKYQLGNRERTHTVSDYTKDIKRRGSVGHLPYYDVRRKTQTERSGLYYRNL